MPIGIGDPRSFQELIHDRRAREILEEVAHELARARRKFGPIASHHEGNSVLREELQEVEKEVFADRGSAACKEAIQLAAMAVRFVLDLQGTPNLTPTYGYMEGSDGSDR